MSSRTSGFMANAIVAVFSATLGWFMSIWFGGTDSGESFNRPNGARQDDAISQMPSVPSLSEKLSGSKNKTTRIGEDSGESSVMVPKVLPTGDLLLPRELISRLQFNPIKSDFTVDHNEMALLGFSKDQCVELESLIEETRMNVISDESKEYEVVSESETDVVLKVPGDPRSKDRVLADLQEKLAGIAGEKAELLDWTTRAAFENLTASFGANDRLICLEDNGSGSFSFEIIELNPGSWNEFSDRARPIDDYRRVSIRSSKFNSSKVPERLNHLFSN